MVRRESEQIGLGSHLECGPLRPAAEVPKPGEESAWVQRVRGFRQREPSRFPPAALAAAPGRPPLSHLGHEGHDLCVPPRIHEPIVVQVQERNVLVLPAERL